MVGDNFRAISSGDMDRLLYNTRLEFAANLYKYHTLGSPYLSYGALSVGAVTNWNFLDSMSDQKKAVNSDTHTRGLNDGIDDQAIAAALSVSTTSTTTTTYNYYHNSGNLNLTPYPPPPTNSVLDDDGIVIFDSTAIRIDPMGPGTILNDLLDDCIQQMFSGDEIGTYRIGTAAPSGGGWQEITTWFVDTTYNQGTTTYKLYLKTDKSTAATAPTEIEPVGLYNVGGSNPGNLRFRDIGQNSNLVRNVMLPYLYGRMLGLDKLFYYVADFVPAGSRYSDRGTFVDTHQIGDDGGVVTFADPTYTKTVTPSGAATERTSKHLYLDWADG